MTRTLDPTTLSVAHDPTVGLRRTTAAVALPLAFALQLACNAVYAWISTASGLTDTEGAAEALELYGRFPTATTVSTVLAMTGVLVMLAGMPAAVRVLRPRTPRLVLWAAALMTAGYVCYLGIVTTNFGTIGLAGFALAHPDAGAVEAFEAGRSPVLVPFFLLFVIGNLVGTLLLGIAVLRSRDLPWYAGALIIGWPVGHVVNIAGGGEWFAVAGGALEVAGLAIVAAAAMRLTDAQWAARG